MENILTQFLTELVVMDKLGSLVSPIATQVLFCVVKPLQN